MVPGQTAGRRQASAGKFEQVPEFEAVPGCKLHEAPMRSTSCDYRANLGNARSTANFLIEAEHFPHKEHENDTKIFERVQFSMGGGRFGACFARDGVIDFRGSRKRSPDAG